MLDFYLVMALAVGVIILTEVFGVIQKRKKNDD